MTARGECPFSTKAAVASTAGAVAMIVVETRRHIRTVRMKGHGMLPAVMVAGADWQKMERCLSDALVSFDDGKKARGGITEVVIRAGVVWILCRMGLALFRRIQGRSRQYGGC